MLKPLAAALLLTSPALGSSEDAGAAFTAEVENACLSAAVSTLLEASAEVDPFGRESYGLAIVSGRTGYDCSASKMGVLYKKNRSIQIGGELDVAVTKPGLQPLNFEDIEDAALAGEQFSSFETESGTLLLAAGDVASDRPAEAVVKLPRRLMSLSAPGGFDAIIDGTAFVSAGGSALIEVPSQTAKGGGFPATLTVQPEGKAETVAEGLWRCGP